MRKQEVGFAVGLVMAIVGIALLAVLPHASYSQQVNAVCQSHQGVQQITTSLIVCKDGSVQEAPR